MITDLDTIINSNKLTKLSSGLIVTEGQLTTLIKYGIDINNCQTLNEILFLINDYLNNNDELEDEEYDELDNVSSEISERNYYQNTNK